MLTGGLANTSFIGLPMIEAFYGPQFLGLGILIDQLGSYFVLSTLGILVASLYSSGHGINAKAVIRKIALFVPFQAFVLAFLLMPFEYPVWLDDLLKRLGATLVPLALVSVGYQLQLSHVRGKMQPLIVGLAFKLVVGPALILLLFLATWPRRIITNRSIRNPGGIMNQLATRELTLFGLGAVAVVL